MSRVVVPLLVLGVLGMLANALIGWFAPYAASREAHVAIGLAAPGVLALGHCLVLSLLSGSAKAIHARTVHFALDDSAARISVQLKRLVYPWLIGAIVALVLTVILGAATDSREFPPAVHGGLAAVALGVNAYAVLREIHVLRQNAAVWTVFHQHLEAVAGAPRADAGPTPAIDHRMIDETTDVV